MDFTYPSPEIVNMKAVSGAIIILAGAMLCGAGAIAEAISTHVETISAVTSTRNLDTPNARAQARPEPRRGEGGVPGLAPA